MQSDWKEIYKLTAKRTGKSEQMYKEVGNFVFSKLYKTLRRPKSLITKLRGIGTWYLRKRRMEIVMEHFPPNFEKQEQDFKHPLAFLQNENKKEVYELFGERLKDYEKYLALRNEIRLKRNETQVLIQPIDRKD